METATPGSSEKAAHNLQVIFFIIVLLYIGQNILIPLAFAGLVAVLLVSPSNFLERKGLSRISSALITVVVGVLFFLLIAQLITSQLIAFKKELPLIAQRLTEFLEMTQEWLIREFHIDSESAQEYLNSATGDILSRTSDLVGTTFITLSRVLFLLLIIPIYIFLILIYRRLIVSFITSSFKTKHTVLVLDVLVKTRGVVRSYLSGLFIETIIVAILHCLGFLILGVRYAILLGVISALLKLIPYLGMLSACVLCPLVTLTTNTPGVVLGVLVVLVIVHLIDGNLIFPLIVGAKVKMNVLSIIVGVIIGNALWGIAGMFLVIPILAILKVIFDNVERFQPLGLLLGEDVSLRRKPKISVPNNEVNQS